jgi:nucleoid-associated protein
MYSGNTGKAFGCFEANEDEFPAQRYIRQHVIHNEYDFIVLSEKLMERLVNQAGDELLATGGYVLFARISVGETHYVLIAIVTETVGTAITDGLDVIDSVHLDLSHLRVAGRIDLNAWQAGVERYISFLKGRGDIADYFKTFIGCNDVLKPLVETQKLVTALEAFATEQGMTVESRGAFLERAHQFIVQLPKNSPLSLSSLANHSWPDEPEKLTATLSRDEFSLSDGFVPDRRAAKGLVNFEGKSQFWKLNFSRAAIKNGHVEYDAENQRIILKNIPDDLRQELLAETAEIDDDEPQNAE